MIGVVLGGLGGRLHHHLPGGGLTARYEGIYAIGFALVAFGLAEVTWGNGLIAAFVCGIAMAATEREVPEGFVEFAENASAILQVLTFFVFGALIVATGFHHSVPPLIVFVLFALLVARPAAVLLSFIRTGIPRSEKLFMAWFGPKGVASMLFALLVLKSDVGDGDPDLRHRLDRDHRLDRRPRPDRHGRRQMDCAANGPFARALSGTLSRRRICTSVTHT